jgi:hypothetical protein
MNVCPGLDVDLREVHNVVILVPNNFLCDGASHTGHNLMAMLEQAETALASAVIQCTCGESTEQT